MENAYKYLCVLAYMALLTSVNGTSTLTLPASTNCGDNVVLTCNSTDCTNAYKFLGNDIIIYNHIGPQNGIDPARYSATKTSKSQVQLTISNMQLSDVRTYSCSCGFDIIPAGQILQYECKASTSSVEVTPIKQLKITVDHLYPIPSNIVTRLTSSTTQLPGTHDCEPSSTFALHFRCTWASTASLPDGNHGYTSAVTTGTQISSVSGSFRLVTGLPSTPEIIKVVHLPNGQIVLLVIPGSHGGYNQTLVAQFSTDDVTWNNVTSRNVGLDEQTTVLNINNTHTSTLYHVRVFAFNNKGRSRYFSATMTFTTDKENDEQQCLGPAVNNLIAATVAACATVILTVLIIICVCRCCPDCSERLILRLGHCVSKKKRMFSDKPAPRQVRIRTSKTTTLSDVESKYANSDVTENETTPSYESLQETGQHSIYTELQ